MAKRPDDKRPLTPDEKKLWRDLAKTIKPIHRASPRDEEEDEPYEPVIEKKSAPLVKVRKQIHALPYEKPKPALKKGTYANIDHRTADRFRLGQMEIDGTLDLHGMTREKAHTALYAFLHKHYGRGSRCLLVVTGKGRGDAPGVLRESMPGWLSADELRPMVLAFDGARPQHGGNGAYYVLLKRKR